MRKLQDRNVNVIYVKILYTCKEILQDTLQDTFDDPYMAYAQVEEAFRQISQKMTIGVEAVAQVKPLAQRPMVILNNVIENKN